MQLAFVIPVYNERDTVRALAEGIFEHAAGHDVSIIYVDDGSADGSSEALDALAEEDDRISVVHFTVNRGKSDALAAGFARAEADVVFTMDSDLQDDPREIPRFLDKLAEGYDVVTGWKKDRQDPSHKTWLSGVYNEAVAVAFRLDLHDINCGFKAYRGEVVKRLDVYGDRHRLLPILAKRLGYSVAEIPVLHHPRRHGKSKYGLDRYFRGLADLVTMWFLWRYAERPGHLFLTMGLLQAVFGAALMLLAALGWLAGGGGLGTAACFLAGLVIAALGKAAMLLGLLAEWLLEKLRANLSR